MSLSLCMIVKDEAALLGACLESVRGWVDEIVVADTGSSDETAAIALAAGARVYDVPWTDDFAAARNAALEKVTGDWVLVLDADEVLLPQAKAEISAAMARPELLAAVLLRREEGNGSPWSAVSRLFRRHPGIRFNRPYHESIDDAVLALRQQESHWQVAQLTTPAIAHSGYRPERINEQAKAERTERLLSAYLEQHPDDTYSCSKLGALKAEQGDSKAALKLLRHGLKRNPSEPELRYELHFHLGLLHQREGDLERAARHYHDAEAVELTPCLKLGAISNLAQIYREEGRLGVALNFANRAVQIDPGFVAGWYNLGILQRQLGNLVAAVEAYQRGITLNPTAAALHQNLGTALLQAGQIEGSRESFRTAVTLYREQGNPEGEALARQLENMGIRV